MVLSVKNKIWLGTLFLFLLLLLTGGVGIYYTLQLKDQAKAVLQDNYETLSYAHGMQKELDAFTNSNNCNLPAFDSMLRLQEQNITEPGEEQATRQVRKDYQQLKTGDTSKALLLRLRSNLQQIISLNMEAINTKSKNAEAAASNTLKYIMGWPAWCFLLPSPSLLISLGYYKPHQAVHGSH